jgi:deferrochelatase/peroxidase EfeB
MKETTSKTIDGITDLVVIAPIKDGFIKAFETISFASRLELAANALNKVRVAAREYERAVPYSDVTERILSLLDFRVGVLDRDLFGFAPGENDKLTLKPRRYLYLTATFEGGFEPYMRQIWRPLGTFLDLLFCNCEGYVTATEHGFEEYIQWVRDHQMDSAIFYSTTGLTVRDHKYLSHLERAQRSDASDLELAKLTMPYPEDEASKTRQTHFMKAVELGLEAINVLHKLAHYYPPEWMTGPVGDVARENEGHRLIRVTRDILRGWDPLLQRLDGAASSDPTSNLGRLAAKLLAAYEAPLDWYRTGRAYVAQLDTEVIKPDPKLPPGEVQAGILKSHGSASAPVRFGALMLFSVRDADGARRFLQRQIDTGVLRFEGDGPAQGPALLAGNIAFTPQGLLEMGMYRDILDRFPKEFREGLALRSGLVGDMRENHPRNWMLPERNGPALLGLLPPNLRLPPIGLDEVDFVFQLRGCGNDAAAFRAAVLEIAREGIACVALQGVEWLNADYDEAGRFRDHFGFIDGISQPRPRLPDAPPKGLERDQVALGEVLLGYANDRGDGPPELFGTLDAEDRMPEFNTSWRNDERKAALRFQACGSYLVVRKIGTNVTAFDAWLDQHKAAVAAAAGCSEDEARARLKAAVMGRNDDGSPLVPTASADPNDFDYRDDAAGVRCPHAAHMRRANPRRIDPDLTAPAVVRREFDRPTPRLLRRGMLFGEPGAASRGLMFMAYVTSISEQYEVIQRWLNGGNPTDIASANNDPLTGVRPREGEGTFRFITEARAPDGTTREIVLALPLPRPVELGQTGSEPGRHPFTPLYWGLYLFSPARTMLRIMIERWKRGYKPLGRLLEQAVGEAQIRRLGKIEGTVLEGEWKRILEDFMTKDPSERDISPHVWAAIRYYAGGIIDIGTAGLIPPSPERDEHGELPNPPCSDKWRNPDWTKQPVTLCAGMPQVMRVLADWENFTSEEQLRRITPNAGPIYVTQQPDNRYICLSGEHTYPRADSTLASQKLDYHAESHATNSALLAYPEDRAFEAGYRAGLKVLNQRKQIARELGRSAFKIEMRREYFQPALAEVWRLWYGLPDDNALRAGAWSWKRIVDTVTNSALERDFALCPGDFMAPSRGSVFPRPNASISDFAQMHGTAILKAGRMFVARMRADASLPRTALIQKMFDQTADDEVLARNIIGTMIGAIPPMEANLRNVVFEWLQSRRLWRHQAVFLETLGGRAPTDCVAEALASVSVPVAQAMCIRPAPDMLFRTAKRSVTIPRFKRSKKRFRLEDAVTREGDMMIVSLVSASQWALYNDPTGESGIDVIFGGKRSAGSQGYLYGPDGVRPDPDADDDYPVHACPAQAMAMGGMKGILAALLEAGRIEALPASLILRISEW